jgi:mRNA interferase MazF
VVTPAQGELWWSTDDKRRPVLVVTRSHAIPMLHAIVVAPVTSNVRGLSTEVPVGTLEGLTRESAAAFDNLTRIDPRTLTERIGTLGPLGPLRICRALEALADCD